VEGADLLGPELTLLVGAAVVLIWDAFVPHPFKTSTAIVALIFVGLSAAYTGSLVARDVDETAFDGMLVSDSFSYFFRFLFAGIAATVIIGSIDYVNSLRRDHGEFYALILAGAAGLMLLASTRDLIAIFIALELSSISQYVLASFGKDGRSSEAGIKYLLLGAIASAVLLYGMAFLYGLSGSTDLADIARYVDSADDNTRAALVMAVVFLIAGFGFKMAVVPFQMWVPDVYQGAPTPVAAWLSVGSKAAAFAVVTRVFFEAFSADVISDDWSLIFAVISAVSMTAGNLLALTQSNIKRMLGYSSVAQAGTFLIGLAAISTPGEEFTLGASSVVFVLAVYAFTNLGAFLAVLAISNRIGSDEIKDYAGLHKRAPLAAGALALCLLSLTGIPPTAGFIAKLYIFNAAVESDLIWLVVVAVLNSVLSAFYYLRVAGLMFLGEPATGESIPTSAALKLALTAAVAGIVFVGVVPSPLLDAAKDAAAIFNQ
jgi:NADH-quinone oxidoreductase subunit N